MFQLEAAGRIRPGLRAAGAGDHGLLQILVEIRNVQVVLVHAADRRQYRPDGRLALAEQHEIHRHRAEGDVAGNGREDDPGIGAVESGTRHEAERKTPAVPLEGQLAVLAVELVEYLAVTVEQARAQLIELHFLDAVLTGDHGLEVQLHACLGRAPAEQSESVAGKLGLGEERRQSCKHQDDDRPGRKCEQEKCIAPQRQGVLEQAEGPVDEAQRPTRRFTPRLRQFVVELGVLEVRELQGQGLLEDHHVDPLSQLRPQQRLAGRNAALAGRHRNHDQGFKSQETQDAGYVRPVRAHRGDDRVDDELADPCDQGRQDAGAQCQHRQRERQAAIGRPYEFEGAPAVGEYAERTPEETGVMVRGLAHEGYWETGMAAGIDAQGRRSAQAGASTADARLALQCTDARAH